MSLKDLAETLSEARAAVQDLGSEGGLSAPMEKEIRGSAGGPEPGA